MFGKRIGTLLGAAAIAMTTVACSATDPGLTTAVKSKLAADDTVKSYRIDVDTKDAVVTLNGAVDTAAARTRAVELARGTDGVRDVVDRLTVTPGTTPTTGVDDKVSGEAREASREADAKTDRAKRDDDTTDRDGNSVGDAGLTTKVKTKFLADNDISGLKIDVDSKNGIVTLTGNVPTAAEKALALKVAKSTDGVKSVVDRLKVVK
ncbi:MAG: BON domain-containing protein [Acidobacteriota bacterium]|nr:BON domain-containing protein [Acidobacteriota bacterium]